MDIQALLIYALHYVQDNYTTILAYLAAGGGVSVLLQFLKKLRKWERSAWIQTVLAVFSGLAATADYVINNYTTSPLSTIFGDQAPKILVAALLMHRIAVNPLSKLIEKQLQGMINKAAGKAADVAIANVTPQVSTPSEPEKFQL